MVVGHGGVGVNCCRCCIEQSMIPVGINFLRCRVTPGIELGRGWLGTGASEGGNGMAVGMVIVCHSRAMANFQLLIICSILSSVWSI